MFNNPVQQSWSDFSRQSIQTLRFWDWSWSDCFTSSKLTSRIYLEFCERVIVRSRSRNNVRFFDFENCLLDAVTILVVVHSSDIFSFVHYTKNNQVSSRSARIITWIGTTFHVWFEFAKFMLNQIWRFKMNSLSSQVWRLRLSFQMLFGKSVNNININEVLSSLMLTPSPILSLDSLRIVTY